MASAVVPMRSRGRSPRRTSHHARAPSAASVAAPTASSIHSSRPSVSLTSLSGTPITSEPSGGSMPGGRPASRGEPLDTESARYSPAPETSTSE